MKKLRVGFIGFGTIAEIHEKVLKNNPYARLICICSLDKIQKNEIRHYYDYQEMILKEKLDCVHILTPHYLHYEMIEFCNNHNLNILVEKPIVVHQENVLLLEKLKPQKKIGCVMQNRYNPTTICLKNILENQDILGIKAIMTWNRTDKYYEEKDWRSTFSKAGSGVLYNQAIHTIDLIQYLCGEYVTLDSKIFNISLEHYEIEDTAVLRFIFKNHAIGLLFLTNSYIDNSSIDIEVITKDFIYSIKEHILYETSKITNERKILEIDPLVKNQKIYYGPSHETLINQFYQSILDNNENYIHISEALKSVKIIENILEQNKK